jgi:hypothetical protein
MMLLAGRPEGDRPLGRPGRRWEVNIKMDLWEVAWSDVDWVHKDPVEGCCGSSASKKY